MTAIVTTTTVTTVTTTATEIVIVAVAIVSSAPPVSADGACLLKFRLFGRRNGVCCCGRWRSINPHGESVFIASERAIDFFSFRVDISFASSTASLPSRAERIQGARQCRPVGSVENESTTKEIFGISSLLSAADDRLCSPVPVRQTITRVFEYRCSLWTFLPLTGGQSANISTVSSIRPYSVCTRRVARNRCCRWSYSEQTTKQRWWIEWALE